MSGDEADPVVETLSNTWATVTVAHGCYRQLTWRVTLARPVRDWAALRAGLIAAGHTDHTRVETVWDLELTGGHRLLVVPATGRVELRLHYLSEEGERPALALEAASAVAEVAGSVPAGS